MSVFEDVERNLPSIQLSEISDCVPVGIIERIISVVRNVWSGHKTNKLSTVKESKQKLLLLSHSILIPNSINFKYNLVDLAFLLPVFCVEDNCIIMMIGGFLTASNSIEELSVYNHFLLIFC